MNVSGNILPNHFSNEDPFLLPKNLKGISISTPSNLNISNPSQQLELLEEEITDPDLRLAIQFQREELEQELLRKKQQQEDEKFAFELQNQVDNDSVGPLPINTDLESSAPLQGITVPRKNESPADEIKEYGDDDEICVVCLNDERNSIFVPCAHRSCCRDCAKNIYRKKGFCPLCWMTLEGVIDCEKAPDRS